MAAHILNLVAAIRPSNMRTVHRLRELGIGELGIGEHSTSAARCAEDFLADPWGARASGGGMDAPDELPAGSVKAFVGMHSSRAIGFCQRDAMRPS